ncbi:hypothetical protein FRC15_004378 [Serendipita sp. 397]|nr:hypothetical protein FRC15_004378 [Serendipita sp. 397]
MHQSPPSASPPHISIPNPRTLERETLQHYRSFSQSGLNSVAIPNSGQATTTSAALRHPLNPALFLCDIQEGLRNKVYKFSSVVNTAVRMVQYAGALNFPVFVAEQKPSVVGRTVSELSGPLRTVGPLHVGTFTKNTFSMVTPGVQSELDRLGIQSVIVLGVESHISIFQTVLELLRRGLNVYVLPDGISSQNKEEIGLALDRMKQAGAIITSSECIAFEMLWDTDKSVSDGVYAVNKSTKAITAACLRNLVGDGQGGDS